ncbi:dihydrofolate reductase family protein [Allorhizocola rhizosphaerae]|uniref:dihydrofolate reductase family protein n=1 Tax=Allorhizocola rhizosphaerae TaxID=1872709 RepID=UPI000E3B9E68|nr:dihydrofolate reductase family protein [Allorhizocola rhizosphaerae]
MDTELLAAYLPEDRGAPMVRLNMVTSLDGAVTLDGRSGPLGGPKDQELMGLLRMMADVVMVGANTVRVEGYRGSLISDEARAWRVQNGLPPDPIFEIAHLRDVPDLLAKHARKHLLCEGGPHIFGALAGLDAIDELCLTIGPMLVGPGAGRITAGAPHPPRRMRMMHAISVDQLLFLRYRSSVTI